MNQPSLSRAPQPGFGRRLARDLIKSRSLYLMLVPVLAWYIIFCYFPMYGIVIAFKNYKPRLGIMASGWVGFKHFQSFFSSIYFFRIVRNTVLISLYSLLYGFPVPIIFALLLNEVQSLRYKKLIQTVTYLPHFITTVIICALVLQFTNSDGVITKIFNTLTGHKGSLIADQGCFRTIYIASGIWQGFGWGSIIYLAAMMGINPELYEASYIDGANKLRQMLHITIPGILPTITIMFILNCGSLMSVGWEKTFLLQSPLTYETSDVISTYVYRKGFEDMDYSYSTAVSLFNSIINVALLVIANNISRRLGETSLW